MGNFYQMSIIVIEQFVISEVFFGGIKNVVDGLMGGENIIIFFYKVVDNVDVNFDNFDLSIEIEDFLEIGFGFYIFVDDEEGEFILVLFIDFDGNLIFFELGVCYIVVFEWVDQFMDVFFGINDDFMYFQIVIVVCIFEWFFGGFGFEMIFVVWMCIVLVMISDDILLLEVLMNIFLNLVVVNDQLNVCFDFDGNLLVMLVVVDFDGCVINFFEYEDGLINEIV